MVISLLAGAVLIAMAINEGLQYYQYNKTPDLTKRYPRPIDDKTYKSDSVFIRATLDSLAAKSNRIFLENPDLHMPGLTDSAKVDNILDTIIYSPKGDQVLVTYMQKCIPSEESGEYFACMLRARVRKEDAWALEDYGGVTGRSFDSAALRKDIRKYFFNQYSFVDEDSLEENYFWKPEEPGIE